MLDFTALYSEKAIRDWGLPQAAQLDPEGGEFRGLLLDLRAIADAPTRRAPPLRLVCCDVLTIAKPVVIDRSTFIFARRIEVADGASLTIDGLAQGADLRVATQTITGKGKASDLPYVIVDKDSTEHAGSLSAPEGSSARAWSLQGAALSPISLQALAADFLSDGSPLALLLRCQMQVAILKSTSDLTLSRQIALWVAAMSAGSTLLSDMALDASALAGRLGTQLSLETGALLAPSLDHKLYADQALALSETLRDRAAAVARLQDAVEEDQRWIDDVKATLADKESDKELDEALVNLAERAVESASKARVLASIDIRQQSSQFAALRVDFQRGISDWEKREKITEAVAIIKGVLNIATSLPAIFAGAPHVAAMPMLESAVGLFDTATGLANSAFDLLGPSAAPKLGGVVSKAEDDDDDKPVVTVKVWPKGKDGQGKSRPIDIPPRKSVGVTVRSPLLLSSTSESNSGSDGDMDYSSSYEEGSSPISRRTAVQSDDEDDDDWSDDMLAAGYEGDDENDHFTVVKKLAPNADSDLVLVNPSKEAKAFASIYNAQLEAAEKSKARNQKLQDELLKGLKGAAEGAKGIYDGAMRIAKITAQAEELETQSRAMLARVDLALDTAMSGISDGLDTVTGGAQVWDELAADIDNSFEAMGNLVADISGARAFRNGIARLIRLGHLMSDARLAVARANFDLAAAKFRAQAAKRSTAIFSNRLESLEDRAKRRAAMEMLAFQRVLDAKCSAWLAMESYDRALRYFTLQSPDPRYTAPNITAPVDAFLQRARAMGQSWVTSPALSSAKPQPMTVTLRFETGGLGARLDQSKGQVAFECRWDDPFFSSYSRIRVEELSVKIEGLRHQGPVQVIIVTTGTFDDRLPDGSKIRFISDPYRIGYAFKAPKGDVIMQGKIITRMAEDFFLPTPFTKWTLRIVDNNTSLPLSLEGVQALEMTLTGNWCMRDV